MKRPGSPDWFDTDIIYPMDDFQRDAVRHAQRTLRVDETGLMDDVTRASLRALQSLFGLRVTGMLDLQTAVKIEQIRNQYA